MSSQIFGSNGFVEWFYSIIYLRVIRACKNIYVRLITHLIGLIIVIFGLFALITTTPSITSVLGIISILLGIVIFITPFGINV